MTVQALLSDLQALGVTLETHGDRLRFHPRDAVCPDLLARLRDQKRNCWRSLRPQRPQWPRTRT